MSYEEPAKKKKRVFTLAEKLDWVEKFNASGMRLSKFLHGTGIPYTTFAGWVNDFKEGVLNKKRASDTSSRHKRTLRKIEIRPVEAELVTVLRQRIESGKRKNENFSGVSWSFMRDQAMKIAKKNLFGDALANFIVTDSWLEKARGDSNFIIYTLRY
jgi:hypothetical protein